ncbi:hypothetical protein QL285_001072 [Trifolium repens]|nr:hypothetical protein QL285_001072 [Trifolium repens]
MSRSYWNQNDQIYSLNVITFYFGEFFTLHLFQYDMEIFTQLCLLCQCTIIVVRYSFLAENDPATIPLPLLL